MDPASPFSEMGDWLGKGAIGLGAIALVVFAALDKKNLSNNALAAFLVLSTMALGLGGFLEWRRQTLTMGIPANACTTNDRKFGRVRLTWQLINKDGTSTDTASGTPMPSEPLKSGYNIQAVITNTTTAGQKTWRVFWTCDDQS